jgi:hypothetical protein
VSWAAIEHMAGPQGTLLLGSPDEVAERLIQQHELLGNTRYIGQIDVGGQPLPQVARGIELLATNVAPVVRKAVVV